MNGLFGTEENSSLVRIELTTESKKTFKVCKAIIASRANKEVKLSVKHLFKILAKVKTINYELLRNLIFNGVLV